MFKKTHTTEAKKHMTKTYEKQTNESPKSWLWFRIYRDLLHQRTFKNVIKYIQQYNQDLQTHKQKKTKQDKNYQFIYGYEELPIPTISNLQNLSKIHKWKKRVTDYDNHLDQVQREQREQQYIEEEKKYLQLMQDSRKATQQYINALNEDVNPRIRTTSKLHALKSASQTVDTLYKDLRLAHGKSTENNSTNINADITGEVKQETRIDFNDQLTNKEFHKNELNFLKQLIQKE